MWPTWWWPQALMQPEILILRSPISSWRAASRSEMRCAIGIERALASAQ